MATKTYEKSSNERITENFSIAEFHCQGKQCGCETTLHDPGLSAYLQKIRDHFGKPIHITSGYRCKAHNASIGGSQQSRHCTGQAADFYIQDVSPAQIAAFAESIGVMGIGLYEDFVHIDTRTTPFFWKGHDQIPVKTFREDPGVYAVTCQIGSGPVCYTLIFDAAAGDMTQRIGNTQTAIVMSVVKGEARFSPVTIGTEVAKILHIRKLTP